MGPIVVAQVQALPLILGGVDVHRTLQLLPACRRDQTQILLDGAPVYNAAHLFGFLSVFISDALTYVELIKGGLPARYGRTRSSVLDMGMNDGNPKRFPADVAIGAVVSRMPREGPVVKDWTSFIVSARRTYIDGIMRPFMPPDDKGI